jgi:hypothetical protein
MRQRQPWPFKRLVAHCYSFTQISPVTEDGPSAQEKRTTENFPKKGINFEESLKPG